MNVTDLKKEKITVFGDSIGKGITTDSGKPEVLKTNAVKLFEEEYGVEINNLSSFGNSVKRIAERRMIERYIETLDRTVKNVVVLELGGNDADFNWKTVAESPYEKHESKTSLKEFSEYYTSIIAMLLKEDVEVIVCTIPPALSTRYFVNVISDVADGNKVLEFFHRDLGVIYRRQEMFNNEILKIAYSNEIEVIDIRKKFLDVMGVEDLMCEDGIHPNEKGQREIFNAVKEYLQD